MNTGVVSMNGNFTNGISGVGFQPPRAPQAPAWQPNLLNYTPAQQAMQQVPTPYAPPLPPAPMGNPYTGYLPQINKGQKWGSKPTDEQARQWKQYYGYNKGNPLYNVGMKFGYWLGTGRKGFE